MSSSDALALNARGLAKRERSRGNVELAGIVDSLADEIEALEAEVARLREALLDKIMTKEHVARIAALNQKEKEG